MSKLRVGGSVNAAVRMFGMAHCRRYILVGPRPCAHCHVSGRLCLRMRLSRCRVREENKEGGMKCVSLDLAFMSLLRFQVVAKASRPPNQNTQVVVCFC